MMKQLLLTGLGILLGLFIVKVIFQQPEQPATVDPLSIERWP